MNQIHGDINLSFLITMNMVKQLSDLTDEKLGFHQLDTSDTNNWYYGIVLDCVNDKSVPFIIPSFIQ
ncbi:hypothetical protein P8452_43394 [Trifolium repens]|nr:hypothetical protein P8452_43394 [Trifolium repens]